MQTITSAQFYSLYTHRFAFLNLGSSFKHLISGIFPFSICSPLEYFIHFHDLEYYSHYTTMTSKSKSPAMIK